MTDLTAIAYVSSASWKLSVAELEAMLADARDFNARVDVTGVLLHHDGGFFQYFEGPAAGMAEVYERIRRSRQHHAILELLNDPVAKRAYPDWRMGSTEVPVANVLSLRDAAWRPAARAGVGALPVGQDLLRLYWATLGPHRPR